MFGSLFVTLMMASAISTAPPRRAPALAQGAAPSGERVLLIGDSNFFGPLGHTLRRELMAQGHEVKLRGKPTSGLARPDFFDWFEEADRLIAEFHPTIIVAMLGANDVQRITWPSLGDRIQWREEARWRPAYEGRVRRFMRELSEGGRTVYYLSPTNRGWDIARDAVTRVREVQARAARGLPRVHWIDMFPLSSDETGAWLRSAVGADGKTIWFRQPDRIHLTKDGGKLIGARVLEVLRRLRS